MLMVAMLMTTMLTAGDANGDIAEDSSSDSGTSDDQDQGPDSCTSSETEGPDEGIVRDGDWDTCELCGGLQQLSARHTRLIHALIETEPP
eukprot:gene3753-20920_t